MYGSAGIGGPGHVFAEQFKAIARLSLDHVPFRGAPALALALSGSLVPVGIEGAMTLHPLIQAGKVWPLAVSGAARMPLLPDVPTFAESGIPDIGVSWMAVMAPKGTRTDAVTRLNHELARVLALPDLVRAWTAIGRGVGGGTPDELAARIAAELPRWRETIDRAGIRPE